MKTVTGGVIAVESVSLSKATTLLSSFASSENGATQDVGAYLRRASVAFTELMSLHVELKSAPLICSDERKPTRKSDPVSQELKAESNERKKKKKKKSRS